MADLRAAAARLDDQDGTVLVLVPVGLLIIIMLGAMAFDLSLAYAGERRVADLAASWADDAATRVDDLAFYGGGNDVAIDLDLAREVVLARADELDDPGLFVDDVEVDLLDPTTIRVTVTGRVPLLFLDAVPGMAERVVASTSIVRLVVD